MDRFRFGLGVVMSALLVAGIAGVRAQESTQVLPISTFIDALPPGAVDVWIEPTTGDRIGIDTFGKRNAVFGLNVGTAVTGQVTIRDLGDGLQRVTVTVHSKDAICWGFNGASHPAFGYLPVQIKNGLGSASLGDEMLRIVYVQPVGPIFPFGGGIESITATVSCDGELRHGSGWPDGTPGFAQSTQIERSATGVPEGCPPEQDANCWPAEHVMFKPKGN